MDYNTLILAKQHFRSNGTNHNRDAKSMIIDRIEQKRIGQYYDDLKKIGRSNDKTLSNTDPQLDLRLNQMVLLSNKMNRFGVTRKHLNK